MNNSEVALRMVETIGRSQMANLVFKFGLAESANSPTELGTEDFRHRVLRRIVELNKGFLPFLVEVDADAIALELPQHMPACWELLNIHALIELCEIGRAVTKPFFCEELFLDLSPRKAIEAWRKNYAEITAKHQKAYQLFPLNRRVEALGCVVGMIPLEFDLPCSQVARAA